MAWEQTMHEAGKPKMRPMGIQRGSSRRPAFRAIFLSLLVGLTGCAKQPINPPRLIIDNDTDMTIQLFLQATILLSRAYGFEPMPYEEIQARTVRAGFKTIPLMIPDTIRATPDLRARMISDHGVALEDYLANKVGTKPLIKYYIRTGLRASQLICRNYLTRLDEANAYLQFIKDEFGVAAGLASSALVLAGANATLKDSFLLVRGSVDQGFSAYEEFRFLNIDRQAARLMVEAAQAKLAEHYFKRADEATLNDNSAAGGYTFSDAIDAISVIEYQCTREGIRFLLNRSISNTPTNMAVDPSTGTIVFKSTGVAVQDAIIDEQKPTGQQNVGGGGAGPGGGTGPKKDVTLPPRAETDAQIASILKTFVDISAFNKSNLGNFLLTSPLKDSQPVLDAGPGLTIDTVLDVSKTQFTATRKQLLALARRLKLIPERT